MIDDEDMCPNCLTPWKCNGPHILPDEAVNDHVKALDESVERIKANLTPDQPLPWEIAVAKARELTETKSQLLFFRRVLTLVTKAATVREARALAKEALEDTP